MHLFVEILLLVDAVVAACGLFAYRYGPHYAFGSLLLFVANLLGFLFYAGILHA